MDGEHEVDLTVVARHEAGHALACIAVGGTNVTASVALGPNVVGHTDPPAHLDSNDIDRAVVYAAGLLAQSGVGLEIAIDGLLSDIGKVRSTLSERARELTGGSEPDCKDVLLSALVVGAVAARFLSDIWGDVLKVSSLLAENRGTAVRVDDFVEVETIRGVYQGCRAGLVT